VYESLHVQLQNHQPHDGKRSFIASCKRYAVEPFTWFDDGLAPAHSITRLSELLPHNWNRRWNE
jgi:hypothetical protein